MQSRGKIKCVERRSLSTSVYDNAQVDFLLLNLKAVAGTSYANDVFVECIQRIHTHVGGGGASVIWIDDDDINVMQV